MKISFLGDIALVGKYNDLYKSGINPFKELEKDLSDSDFVVGNLECLAEGDKGENLLKRPRLKTKLETLNYIKKLNISAVSLAHNHVYDNLDDGFDKTIKFLNDNDIKYLGAGYSDDAAEKPLYLEKDGIRICFLNYVTQDTNPNLPDNCPIKLNWFDEEKIRIDILKYRNDSNFVVLLLHWGGDYEGHNYPNPKQSDMGKRLIDYGADLIIGHHSHTFQPYEIYKGKYIFHSLGNFCFADWESDGKMNYLWKKNSFESAIIKVNFNKQKYSINFIPIYNSNLIITKQNNLFKKFSIRTKKYRIIKNNWNIYKILLKIQFFFEFILNPKMSLKEKVIRFKKVINR